MSRLIQIQIIAITGYSSGYSNYVKANPTTDPTTQQHRRSKKIRPWYMALTRELEGWCFRHIDGAPPLRTRQCRVG